jgi:hypothetical protein
MKAGNLIKSICSRASSMNQAAKKSKIAQSTLSEWQSEKVTPGLERYVDLCLAMGCRPGFELDQYLGLGGTKPRTAEDVLGQVLALNACEQQRLISLIAGKYSEFLMVSNMIDVDCLIALILQHLEANKLSPERFAKNAYMSIEQYMALMHGVLPASVEDVEGLLSVLAVQLKNPHTKETFDTRDALIEFCRPRKSIHNQEREPNDTNHY